MRSILSVGAVAMTLLALLSLPVRAEMYKYVDKQGSEHYTDSLGSVPEEYRGKAVAIDKDLERNPGFVQETRPPRKGEPDKGTPGTPLRGKIFSSIEEGIRLIKVWTANAWTQRVSGLIVCVIFFLVAGKVGKALGHKQIGTILRIIVTAVVLFFLVRTYLQNVTDSFVRIKAQVMGIKEQKEKRDQIISETAK